MNNETRQRFHQLRKDGLLPSPNGIAMSLLEITQRSNANVSDIVPLVQMDPAMAGRLLRYANAANSGNRRSIVSLKQAVTFLGLFRVRQVALAFALIDQYRMGQCPTFDYPGYWSVSLATGIAAQLLAPQASCPPEESFTCGLLSGIGRLGLATAFPQEYGEILAHVLANDALLAEESRQFGIDHQRLSSEMLVDWGLPGIFAEAVGCHETPTEAPFTPGSRAHALTASLHFAMRIGELLNLDETQRWERVPSLFNAAALASMDKDDVPRLVENVVNRWQDWARELKLPSRDYPDLRALLAAPPLEASQAELAALVIIPLRVVVLVQDPLRLRAMRDALGELGLAAEMVAGWPDMNRMLQSIPMDVAIFDVEALSESLLQNVRALRQAAGPGLYALAVLPAEAEAEAAKLMLAGASDYLLQDAPPTALMARLANAQRQISLLNTLKAEREMVVSASGDWARANRRLIHDALTDVLTQLPNRRYGMDRFSQEWSIASSNALPIACLMLDVDHFKQVNDTHGHDIGDLVLQQMATIFAANCRRSDIVFRYGGEEFCVICPSTPQREATLLASRIVQAVRQAEFGPPGAPFPLTLSIGVAVRDESTPDVAALLSRADKALYHAKTSGRNRVEVSA